MSFIKKKAYIALTTTFFYTFATSCTLKPNLTHQTAEVMNSEKPLEVDLFKAFEATLNPEKPSADNCKLGENEQKITRSANFLLATASCIFLGISAATPFWNQSELRSLAPYGYRNISEVQRDQESLRSAILAEQLSQTGNLDKIESLTAQQKRLEQITLKALEEDSSQKKMFSVIVFFAVGGGSILALHAGKKVTGVDMFQDLGPAAWAATKISSSNIANLFANGLGDAIQNNFEKNIEKLATDVETVFNHFSHPALVAEPKTEEIRLPDADGKIRHTIRITPIGTTGFGIRKPEEFWNTNTHLQADMIFDVSKRLVVADLFLQLRTEKFAIKAQKMGTISFHLNQGKPTVEFAENMQGLFAAFKWSKGYVSERLPGAVALFQESVLHFALSAAHSDEAQKLASVVNQLKNGEGIQLVTGKASVSKPIQLTEEELQIIIQQTIERTLQTKQAL